MPLDEDELTKEGINLWKQGKITKKFFSIVAQYIKDYDEKVHMCLADKNQQGGAAKALFHNAGMDAFKLVEVIPEDIIEELEGKNKK